MSRNGNCIRVFIPGIRAENYSQFILTVLIDNPYKGVKKLFSTEFFISKGYTSAVVCFSHSIFSYSMHMQSTVVFNIFSTDLPGSPEPTRQGRHSGRIMPECVTSTWKLIAAKWKRRVRHSMVKTRHRGRGGGRRKKCNYRPAAGRRSSRTNGRANAQPGCCGG